MGTVLLFTAPREYFRDVIVEQNEIYSSPYVDVRQAGCHYRAEGEYDAADYIATLPAPFNDPTLIICNYAAGCRSTPRNLASVKCPKVLLLGDTHHMHRPITDAVRMAI